VQQAGLESPSRIRLPLLVTLALLASAAPFATDLYLPAFPQMVNDLATSATGVQLSLTAFLIGAGLGQVVFGPLSDRVGRLRPLLVGTAVYVLASAAAALAPTIGLLVAARLLQGLTGAAGMVIGRAVISDLAHGAEAARGFSIMMLVGGVAPVLAPLAGSLLVDGLGWRGLLWIVAGIGVISLGAVLCFVRETRPQAVRDAQRAHQTGWAELGRLANRRFLGNAVAHAFAFATMMAYISASPFLYQDLMGFDAVGYGLAFGLNALALAAVGGVAARLARRHSAVRLSRVGLAVNLGSIATLALLSATPVPAIWLSLPIVVAVSSLGLVMGPTTALALEQVPGAAGLGSAALGLLQFGIAGAVAPLVSIGGTSVVPLAVTMLVASIIANLGFLATRRSLALPRFRRDDLEAAEQA